MALERAVYHMYGGRPGPPRRRRWPRPLLLVLAGLLVVALVRFWLWPLADEWRWESTAPPSCGSAAALPGSTPIVRGTDAELCFVRAVRACNPRSLQYGESGVDSGVEDDLRVVRSSGACRVDVRSSGWVDVSPRSTSEFTCSGARWDGSGWALDCGPSGTLKLPWPGPRTRPFGGPIPDPAA